MQIIAHIFFIYLLFSFHNHIILFGIKINNQFSPQILTIRKIHFKFIYIIGNLLYIQIYFSVLRIMFS